MNPGTMAAIALLAGGAAFAQSVTGFGFSLLVVPPLVLLLGAKEAVLVANVLSTALVVLLTIRLRHDVEWRTWLMLTIGSIAGMPLGLLVLVYVDADILQIAIALNVIVFTVLLMRRWQVHAAGRGSDAATGLVSGILRTSTSMSGPPVVIYLQGRTMAPQPFRATISAFFLASGLIAMVAFALTGRYSAETWEASAAGLPSVFAGMVAGNALYRRVNEARFRHLVIVLLFASAGIALAMVFAA